MKRVSFDSPPAESSALPVLTHTGEAGVATSAATRVRRWSRAAAVSILVFGLTLGVVGIENVWAEFVRLHVNWILVAIGLSVLEVALGGSRWAFLSARAGVAMGAGCAMREYGMSSLLNQVLPGGIVGDVVRVHRHATGRAGAGQRARCVDAALQDRMSGQVALGIVAAITLPFLVLPGDSLVRALVLPVLLASAATLAWGSLLAASRRRPWAARLSEAIRGSVRHWLDWRSLSVHLSLSVGLVLTLVLHYYAAARATGLQLDGAAALATIPWILLATSLPSFLGGWGIREGAAASMFFWIGANAGSGVALSIAFGVLSLVGSAVAAALFAAAAGAQLRWSSRHRAVL